MLMWFERMKLQDAKMVKAQGAGQMLEFWHIQLVKVENDELVELAKM